MSNEDPAGPESARPLLSIPPSSVSILVVDDDPQFGPVLRRDLLRQGFTVTLATGADEAVECLKAGPIDVLLTDLRLEGRDGIALLEESRVFAPNTRPILMSGFASAKDHELAIRLGAVCVLVKPFSAMELSDAIRRAIDCENGFRGSVHGLSLVDMLQMFHFGRRSVSIHVSGGGPAGSIHVRKGELVHAELGSVVGRPALRTLLSRGSGSIQTAALETTVVTISDGFDTTLLDALRELDETHDPPGELSFDEFGESATPAEDALTQAVRAELPGASAWLITSAEVRTLIAGPVESCDPAGVSALARVLDRLEPGWSIFEAVSSGGSVGVIRRGPAETLVVSSDTSRTRSVQRFRSNLARISTRVLPAQPGSTAP